ncbi:FtsX-like permease family protein [Ilyomonas limi]|uniref:FtsX-like permease family protein n=1 Tax=Ilyomonas limi TaxID=2575867 RepID=A0A4U3L0D8_9BACT|nr:ABC transporter permease [Ilyomonas limi]TKK68280.1 FtsX-like permease family protein [Ilyomonas limi]
MLKNYFRTAWRSLLKNKFYTAINISGLAVGLATGIMLLLWVQNELSYDKFHKDYQQIYRLSSHFKSNGEDLTWTGVPGPLSVFAKSIPEVQSVVRTSRDFDQNLSNEERTKIFDGNVVGYVDSGFFSMFNFHFLKGNKATAFPNSNSVVLTQSTAQKLFGNEEAIGKTLQFFKNNFTVTGVLQDFPQNSSIQYDAIFPMSLLAKDFTENGGNGDWKTIDEDLGDFTFTTYVQLQPAANPVKTGQTFSALYKKARNGESDASFQLQKLAAIHLISADGNNAALRMVQIFMLVVVLLLAIASINYVNLSTARSLIRAKEVSIRKIVGAQKGQLFLQFSIETIVLFCLATGLAIVLIYSLMPLYNNISGKTLSFTLSDANVWKAVILAVVGTLVASSIYPALLLSSFKPIESLKGKLTSGISAAFFRKALVVFQFAISVILLVCTMVMSNQMKFVKNKNLGYDKSYVFSVPLTQEVVDHADAVKTELKKQTGILNVAVSDAYSLANVSASTGDLDWAAKPANSNMMIIQISADKDFIPTMKIKFLEGENFTGTPADSAYFVLNETAVKGMGLKQPYVGQQITFHNIKGTIHGVVQDFNFQSLKEKIAPLIFFTNWNNKNILYVRTTAANAQQAIAAVGKQYKKYAGDSPFSYYFLDKTFETQYKSEERAGTLFNAFAGIAIFISCLGLFGLATYTAQVKTKEIGIRKVLGASVASVVQLISKDFLKLVLIAIVIAIPVAWWAMNKWLEDFAYRINISWWIFILAAFIASLIALITVSFQAVRAAIANPVKSLRTE